MAQGLEKKELFCNNVKAQLYYRGFRLNTLKLLIEYTFSGFLIKFENNYRERRFDIFLSKKNQETSADIDLKEVEKFRKFYGKGFNLILFEEAER